MLVRYKKSCSKIAMGLISLMPKEKNVKHLCQTMKLYEDNPQWQLFLLKKDDAYVGLIGIEMGIEEYTIHHISILPSYRGEGLGQQMLEKVQALMQHRTMQSTPETHAFISRTMEVQLVHN